MLDIANVQGGAGKREHSLHVQISGTAYPNFTNFFLPVIWPWLGFLLAGLQLVMYFRFS